MSDDKFFMAAISSAGGVGNKTLATLVNFFGSAKTAWLAEDADLIHAGIRRKQLDAFIAFRRNKPNAPDEIADFCQRHKINLCAISDADYPPILTQIDTPPMFFYYRGQLQPHALRIGIVGSRDFTPYGKDVALDFGEQLAQAGLTVVSGAARGIDTFAHTGALKSGRTVAVLGCGISCNFPPERDSLLARIAERGCVISEFPPLLTPTAGTFAVRNRIIAGLSRGLIVVEATAKSGAVITANYARSYGRDLFAVPCSIYSDKSSGGNNLIQNGASLINSCRDVLDKYSIAIADGLRRTPWLTTSITRTALRV